jgi:hypothetical protein
MKSRRQRAARRAMVSAAFVLLVAACGPTHHLDGPLTTLSTTPAHGKGPSMNLVPATGYRSDGQGAERRRQAMLAYVATLPNALKLGPVQGGDFVETSWCVPKSASYCLRAVQTEGQLGGPGLVVTVSGNTIWQGKIRHTSGLDFSSQDIPDAADQLAVEFQYSEDGGQLFGGGWQLEFVYLTPALRTAIMGIEPVDYFDLDTIDAAVGNELDFADAPEYTTGTGAKIGLRTDAPTALQSLARYFGSARQLRSRMMAREAQLLRQVTADIDQGRVAKPVDCKSSPGAPICANGPLSSTDKERELARAETQIGDNESFVAHHYQQMYALVNQALFWHTCRACWS